MNTDDQAPGQPDSVRLSHQPAAAHGHGHTAGACEDGCGYGTDSEVTDLDSELH
jgi:hypothetical protein